MLSQYLFLFSLITSFFIIHLIKINFNYFFCSLIYQFHLYSVWKFVNIFSYHNTTFRSISNIPLILHEIPDLAQLGFHNNTMSFYYPGFNYHVSIRHRSSDIESITPPPSPGFVTFRFYDPSFNHYLRSNIIVTHKGKGRLLAVYSYVCLKFLVSRIVRNSHLLYLKKNLLHVCLPCKDIKSYFFPCCIGRCNVYHSV